MTDLLQQKKDELAQAEMDLENAQARAAQIQQKIANDLATMQVNVFDLRGQVKGIELTLGPQVVGESPTGGEADDPGAS